MIGLLASLVTVVGVAMADCDSVMDEATFGDFRTCSRSQVKESLGHQASCSPRAVVMRLPWPNSTMVGGGVQQMTPTHVALMQCDGGCHRGSQGCIATATRTREVSVMVGKCGVSVGKCEKECATVTLEEHTKCGCGCQLDRVGCELDGLHRFKIIQRTENTRKCFSLKIKASAKNVAGSRVSCASASAWILGQSEAASSRF